MRRKKLKIKNNKMTNNLRKPIKINKKKNKTMNQ
jgi:hypothetical protein